MMLSQSLLQKCYKNNSKHNYVVNKTYDAKIYRRT